MSHSRYFSGAAGVFFLVSLFAAGYSDLATDKTVLLALRSAVGGRTLLWNTSEPSPCKWVGVYCQSDQVVELHIPGMGLSGKLPENTLGNLTQLNTLSLRKRGKEEEVKQDVRAVKESEAVEIRTEKPVESEGNLGQAVDLKDKGEAKISGGGAKKLVFFGVQEKGFDLEGLLRASAEVLGKGTFGTAYKAVLETGVVVAVKRLREVAVSEKEYREKIEGVGKMDHENLVRLRAYFYSVEENLLVYDYMRMGSLSALLHGNRGAGRTPLNWETRSAIALGAARGIAYIHSQGSTVSHGNIKSSNVLLTTSYEARVSDFGLAQLVGRNNSPNRLDGYRAPEVTDHRKVSQKADVYSFGVLLLELLTGKAPTHALLNEEGVDLPRWVQSVVREEWTAEVFDLELLRYQNVEEDMVQLLQLAIDCSAQYPDKRPSMNEVSQRIQELCVSGSQHDPQNDIIDTDSNAPPSSGAV
ncbi:putative inactive receptor kinase RLK902 isoform X2 [Apium graveolens]|uniref:putative inactive receptor kinase RLK902 isoform X2 n=1 Tax=Apium graveolens TaxID=4045 RepID=UPI003D78E30E